MLCEWGGEKGQFPGAILRSGGTNLWGRNLTWTASGEGGPSHVRKTAREGAHRPGGATTREFLWWGWWNSESWKGAEESLEPQGQDWLCVFVIALCGILQKNQAPCEAGGRPDLRYPISFAGGSGLLPAGVAFFNIGLKYTLALNTCLWISFSAQFFVSALIFWKTRGGVKRGGFLSLAEFNSRDFDPCSVTYKLAGLGQICFRALSQEC